MLITRVRSIRPWPPLLAALPTIQFCTISLLALAGATLIISCGSSGGDGGSGDDCGLQECKLTASDDDPWNELFGWSVAVSGDTIVVGVQSDDAPERRSGSAYVFRFDGTDWVEEQKLVSSDIAPHDYLGRSVAVSGDLIVVGSSRKNTLTSLPGGAYVFHFNGTDWVEEQKLTASDTKTFGSSVSISGDLIVVVGSSPGSSAAYVFRFDGTDWVEEQKLTPSDPAGVDFFGRSTAISGDVIVVGASKDGVLGMEFGAAYVYRFDGTDWIEEQKLTAPDRRRRAWFGCSVAVSGDTIVVGGYGHDAYSGSAYVYRFNGTDWVEEQKLTTSDGERDDRFGVSVSIFGETIVAGAHNNGDSGAAYVFRFDGTDWIEERKLTASDLDERASFGSAVDISGEVIVVGESSNDAAYVFRE